MGHQPYLSAILKLWEEVDEFMQNFVRIQLNFQLLKEFALIWWSTDERLTYVFEFLGDASLIIG